MTEHQSGWQRQEPPLLPDECKAGRLMAIWSIADLAGRSGVDPLTVQRFEAGEAPEVGLQLLNTFALHGMWREPYASGTRWFIEDFPFNPSTNFKPHVGQDFILARYEAGKGWPGDEDLEWPRSDDLPADLFERPVPVPWWARHDEPRNWGPGRLGELEAEWVRRNPDALERLPKLRERVAKG